MWLPREYAKLASQAAGNTMQQVKRLAREWRDLPRTQLTLELGAAAFVRHDADRLDVVRAMIVGARSGILNPTR